MAPKVISRLIASLAHLGAGFEIPPLQMEGQAAVSLYTGSYSMVTDFLRTVRPAPIKPFERRFETPPGRQAQVDFAEFKVEFDDEPGVVRKTWLFTLVLGHSRWHWGRFCADQDLQTVLRCHIDDLAAMAGAPGELLYDRMKTAVRRHERLSGSKGTGGFGKP